MVSNLNNVSVPVLGIIFLSANIKLNYYYNKISFRPRTGDYFFIYYVLDNSIHYNYDDRFRPRTGDYFFIIIFL